MGDAVIAATVLATVTSASAKLRSTRSRSRAACLRCDYRGESCATRSARGLAPAGLRSALLHSIGSGRRARCRRIRPDALRAVFRQEPDPVQQFRVAHLHDRPLRDLLLPGDRAASRARHQLRRERLSAGQLRPEARPRVQGAARPLQDPERVPAAEHRVERAARRRARLRRAVPRSHGAADRRAVRRALSPDHPRADAHLRVRHHPALAAPPRPAAVGRRRALGLHDRLLECRST